MDVVERFKEAIFALQRPSIIIGMAFAFVAFTIIGLKLIIAGNKGREEAKESSLYAVFGVAIVIFAVELVQFIFNTFLGKGF